MDNIPEKDWYFYVISNVTFVIKHFIGPYMEILEQPKQVNMAFLS